MKVLVCGEGRHDIGYFEEWSIRPAQQKVAEGWLQPLLREALETAIDFLVVPRSRLVSLPDGRDPPRPRPAGHGLKAMLAKGRALAEQCEVLIYMLDADTNHKAEWESKVLEVEAGFAALPGNLKCVACVPMSTSESWLLSDQAAWAALAASEVTLPRHPEDLWGAARDRTSNHPKWVFARLCGTTGLDDCRETRVELMETSNKATLVERCPHSFGKFWADVRA